MPQYGQVAIVLVFRTKDTTREAAKKLAEAAAKQLEGWIETTNEDVLARAPFVDMKYDDPW